MWGGGVGVGSMSSLGNCLSEIHVRKNIVVTFASPSFRVIDVAPKFIKGINAYTLQFGHSRLHAVQVVKLKEMFDNNNYILYEAYVYE